MRKKNVFVLIPFLLLAGLLVYCWTIILVSDFLASWRHYVGLLLFLPVAVLFSRGISKVVIGLGIYLFLATFNLLAITPAITTTWIRIGSTGLTTPPVQLLSLAILVLYFILNIDTLIDILLDYNEAKQWKAKSN